MNLTLEGLNNVLEDYLKWIGKYCESFEHDINGTHIEIRLQYSKYPEETIHIDLTTLLIYANTRAIEDRDKIQELENRLDDIADRLYRLDRYED